MKVVLAKDLLEANKDQAKVNRAMFKEHGIVAVNLIGSPGAGKTTLLEKALPLLTEQIPVAVIEGDIFTAGDAVRIAGLGVPVVQINTEGICHLDARMIQSALRELPLEQLRLICIENVGNLVCPAAFDLGEHCKVAVLSMAEGSDKPAKYPGVFREAQAVVLSKADLLPYTGFDLEACKAEILGIKQELPVFLTSAKDGLGLAEWAAWLVKLTEELV